LKNIIIVIFLLSNIFIFSKEKIADINNLKYFSDNLVNDKYYYFSFLNPNYLSDESKQYIFNCSKEIVKFIQLQIDATTDEGSLGSFILSDQIITITYDAEIVNEFIDSVKICQRAKTDLGEVLTLKISKENLNKIWKIYNSREIPSINLKIDQKIHDGIPSWFLNPPKINGFIVGTGSYNYSTDIYNNVKYSDYSAITEIIKTLGVTEKSEITDYYNANADLFSFLSHESASANISGIFIVKRYYDKKTNTFYSLALFKIN